MERTRTKNETAWANELERSRMRELVRRNSVYLPGPGAAAAAMAKGGPKPSGGGAKGGAAGKGAAAGGAEQALNMAAQEATGWVKRQGFLWFWKLSATIKGLLISLPVILPGLNVYFYIAHFKGDEKFKKMDIFEMFQLVAINATILFLIAIIVFWVCAVVGIIGAVTEEFAGLIPGLL